MTELLGAICTIISVIGVVLNNRKMTACFYIWMVSNLISACLHFCAGIMSLAIRDMVFFVLAIEGAIRWKRNQ